MADYDPYYRSSSRRHVRDDLRPERDARHLDIPRDYERAYPSRDLVPRAREDSDLSVEEIRREFPPPSGRDLRRARSADTRSVYYYDDEDDYHGDAYYRRQPLASTSHRSRLDEEARPKPKSLSKQDKIIAAVAGAALLVGGKEFYDRHEAKADRLPVQRNALSSAALAGFGALAGYQGAEFYSKQQAKKDQKAAYILRRHRHGYVDDYHSDDDPDDDPKRSRGSKNFLESALAATGLGAAVKSLTGGPDDDKRSDTRSRRGNSPSSPSSRSSGANKMQKAAMASLLAGATEAFRVAKEPGGWKGEKTKRILTAAAGAATVDAAHGDQHGKMGLAESVIGGLVGNRLINGSKKDIEEDKETGRSRSRSRARSRAHGGGGGGSSSSGSGLAALATAGLGALGAKKMLDRSPSRSRHRDDDSASPSPSDRRRHRRRERSRSTSVVDKARNSLARLGIGDSSTTSLHDDRRRHQDDFDDRATASHRSPRYSSDDRYQDESRHGRRRRGGNDSNDDDDDDDDYDLGRSDRGQRRNSYHRQRPPGSSRYDAHGSDLGDSDEEERRAKRARGKKLLAAGLAAVATIHAAHEIHHSLETRYARQRTAREANLRPREARARRARSMLQDAASVGFAALGIKTALRELNKAKEAAKECKRLERERGRRKADLPSPPPSSSSAP